MEQKNEKFEKEQSTAMETLKDVWTTPKFDALNIELTKNHTNPGGTDAFIYS